MASLTPQRSTLGRYCRSILGARGLCGCTTLRRYDACDLTTAQMLCRPEITRVWLCEPPVCPLGVKYFNACYRPTATVINAADLGPQETFIADANALCSAGCVPTCTTCDVYYRANPCGISSGEVYVQSTCLGSRTCGAFHSAFAGNPCYIVRVGMPFRLQDIPAGALIVSCAAGGALPMSDSCCGCGSSGCVLFEASTPTDSGPPCRRVTLPPFGPCCISGADFTATASLSSLRTGDFHGIPNTRFRASGSQTITVSNGIVVASSPPIPVFYFNGVDPETQIGTTAVFGPVGGGGDVGGLIASANGPIRAGSGAGDSDITLCGAVQSFGASMSYAASRSCYGTSSLLTYSDSTLSIQAGMNINVSYSAPCGQNGCDAPGPSAPPGFAWSGDGILVPSTSGCSGCGGGDGGILI